jgi:enoyl-CoA hydratase
VTDSLVQISTSNSVATVTLNRPDALNALSSAVRKQLVQALHDLQSNPDVRAVILTGSGRAFCAGLDLKELQNAAAEVASEGFIGREMLLALEAFNKPLIAAVNGFAFTGGLELLLYCDVIIASTEAQFADTHAKYGIVPAWGLTQKLPRIIGLMRTKEMSLSGQPINAVLAYDWGLVNRVVEPQELLPTCQTLGEAMVACDTNAQTIIKTLIDEGWTAPIAEGLARERAVSIAAFKPPPAKS